MLLFGSQSEQVPAGWSGTWDGTWAVYIGRSLLFDLLPELNEPRLTMRLYVRQAANNTKQYSTVIITKVKTADVRILFNCLINWNTDSII